MIVLHVIPEINVNTQYLAYLSDKVVPLGQIVQIPIRNKLYLGMVTAVLPIEVASKTYDLSKLKNIKEIFPFVMDSKARNFLKICAYNTFNTQSEVLEALLISLKNLGKKEVILLSQNQEKTQETKFDKVNEESETKPVISRVEEPEFIIDRNISIRIIYIIRSAVDKINNNGLNKGLIRNELNSQQLLFVFPERKLLDKIYSEVSTAFNKEKSVQFSQYSGDKSAKSKSTIRILLGLDNSDYNVQCIFSLRSGLFLPFNNLSCATLIDEANSMYIQDQNTFYFDARDVIYILAQSHLTSLKFISSLPSIRLRRFYSEHSLDQVVTSNTNTNTKPLKVKLLEYQRKSANFGLISGALEQYLVHNITKNPELTLHFENDPNSHELEEQ